MCGNTEPDESGHVFRPGAAIPFVLAAGEDRVDAGAALDPQGARPLGAVELVRGERQEIRAHRPHVHRNLREGLHGVRMKQRATRMRERRELRDRLHGADFVVRVHHRDDGRAVGQRRRQRIGADNPGRVDRKQGSRPASPGEGLEGIEHRLVLDGGGDEVLAARWLQCLGHPPQGEVIRFRPAAREDNLRRIAANQGCHCGPGFVQPRFCHLPEMMDAGGISEVLPQGCAHDFGNRRVDRGRRVMVKVKPHEGSTDITICAKSQQ